jgi:hypothetical protein
LLIQDGLLGLGYAFVVAYYFSVESGDSLFDRLDGGSILSQAVSTVWSVWSKDGRQP